MSIECPLYLAQSPLEDDQLLGCLKGRRAVLVTDLALNGLYAQALGKRWNMSVIAVPSGEKAKSWASAQALIDALMELKLDRESVLVAFGGGTTTDLVGFVASIYLRGVSLVLIPTTLLGMVDAAIGGKTGINTGQGKNLIGTVYHPEALFLFLDLLQTLPLQEWRNGFAEVLKMGLIQDPLLWQKGEQVGNDSELLLKAIGHKRKIVAEDPFDRAVRHTLNFGHTVGHALERVAEYQLPHGHAVGLGCVVEAYLSWSLGHLEKMAFLEIQERYRSWDLQLPANYTKERFLQALAYDKKRAAQTARCVLLTQIGKTLSKEGVYSHPIPPDALVATLDWMEQWC